MSCSKTVTAVNSMAGVSYVHHQGPMGMTTTYYRHTIGGRDVYTQIEGQMPLDSTNELDDAELENLASQISENDGAIFRSDAINVLRELRRNKRWKLVRRD